MDAARIHGRRGLYLLAFMWRIGKSSKVGFCGSSLRRTWLAARLEALIALAASTGKLRRIFIWGSFGTGKSAPKDLDILLIMNEDFEVDAPAAPAQAVFDSVRAKLMFQSDVFLG